jgi:anti-sigma factor RsiW
MTCGDWQDLFIDYLDGEMVGAPRREIEAHLASCAVCSRKLRGVRAVRTHLGRLERRRLPASFSFAVRRMLIDEMERRANWAEQVRAALSPVPHLVWSVAAGLVVALTSFTVLWYTLAPGARPTGAPAAMAAGDSAKQAQSVRYVLEHLPRDGAPIETTAKDSISQPVASPPPTPEAQPVSANF